MDRAKEKFIIRSKIWIENSEGKVTFGLGRFKMLEAIDEFGSMNSADKKLKMSYRSIGCRIRESEERLGQELVVREGKGSTLTPFARSLMQQFMALESKINLEADEMFAHLPFNSFADSSNLK